MEELEYCPFYDFGCNEKDYVEKLRKHIKETPAKHLSLLCDGISELYFKTRQFQLDMENDERFLDITEYRVRALNAIFGHHLVWRIDDVKHRMYQAKDGIEPSVFSPPFYTGKQGYKTGPIIGLEGRWGRYTKGKYASLFLSILKGENDSLLSWPFSHTVTLTLFDQRHDVGSRNNVVHKVTPNVVKENRPFLNRPVGDRNPRFGLQKFIKIQELYTGDYVRDDTIFIKVDVDSQQITPI